ncbi:MAG: replication initiator protein [Microvirus sp.]|nr:MAG: replication initiator protein [Microvirus sp.]
MACFYPIQAYKLENGQISFNEKGNVLQAISLPCGRCVGCRLEKSRQWAIRCIHEAQMHTHNCFITLTYNQEHYEYDLRYKHFQSFMRRLRKTYPGKPIRFYMAGEYGETNGRPHFHACLFGIDFADKRIFKNLPSGSFLYTSASLERLWPFGYSTVGDVTFESAAYVARYILKKQTGKNAETHYQSCDDRTGELRPIRAEFNKMSLKPGIGATWLNKYHPDIYPKGLVIHQGQKMKPPKYYDKYFKKINPQQYEDLQYERIKNFNYEDNTQSRLSDKERVTKAKLSLKKRGFQK